MADSVLIKGKSLEKLESEITCGICQEHYTEPKILPCLHYYCKQCVLRLALRTGTAKPFSCPECRCEVTLPEGGVDNLKTAFFVNRLKTTVSTMERAHGKVEVKCELCSNSEGKAEAFCRQCAMFICKNCVQQHKSLKILLSHEVASLEDLKQGRAKPIMTREPPTKSCSKHEEPLIIYCYKCESLICQHCTVKDHRDHDFEFCKVAAPNTKENLLEKLKPLKNQKESLAQAIISVQTTRQEIEAQGEDVANSIQKSFKELREILDKREKQLLQEAAGNVREKADKLLAQEKNLLVASAEVQSVVDYTEQCVSHCTDSEVMSMHSEIRRQIEQKIEEHNKSEKSLEPAEEADMGVEVRCSKTLQELCQTQANTIELPVDPANCILTVEDGNKEKLHKVCTAILLTRLTNNKISRKSSKVSCSLKSLYNNVVTACKVEEAGAGQYSIQYTPSVRGRHELTVSVDGQQVAGSPFPVFVSIHPTQLGKPVKIWKDLNSPRGITVNSIGEVLVSECNGSIIKLDTDGKRKVLTYQDKLSKLNKVEVDSANNIYCINNISNKVLTCDQDGGNMQVQVIQQDKTGCWSLAIVGEEVMVSGRNNNGTIMILDKELNYKRCIRHGKRDITAISADHHGNLYCADYDSVHVFSNGVFLRSFGCDEKGKKKVNNPWGLCVSGHYVYVCNYGFDNISVFTTDGVYVTSFGQRGRDEGQFNFPHSICVDKDGFVYVIESNNGRIQCF